MCTSGRQGRVAPLSASTTTGSDGFNRCTAGRSASHGVAAASEKGTTLLAPRLEA